MSGPSLDRVLAALETSGKRHWCRGDHAQSQCPSHEDREPSLSIDWKPAGKTLMTCRAGCRTADVIAELGLTFGMLYDDWPRQRSPGWKPPPRRPPDPLAGLRRVLERAVRMINAKTSQRHWRRWAVPWPETSADERIELAVWGEKQDQDRHYWLVVARQHFEEKK